MKHSTMNVDKYEGKVVNLLTYVHNVTLEALIAEFKVRMTLITDPLTPTPPLFLPSTNMKKAM